MIANMKAAMSRPGAREEVERLTAVMEADPEASVLMNAIHSLEDAYAFVKRYAEISFESFKEVFTDAVNYFKEDKAVLQDEVLDNVVGGFSWSSLWNNKIVKYAVAVTVVAASMAAGFVVGAAAGAIVGPTGSVVGGITGFVGGCALGLYLTEEYILK